MGRERMPVSVWRCQLDDTRFTYRLTHGPLERLISHVVAPLDTAARISRALTRWENVLPRPAATCVRIFVR